MNHHPIHRPDPNRTPTGVTLGVMVPQETAAAPVRSRHGGRGRHRAVPPRRTARQFHVALHLAVRALVRAVARRARTPRPLLSRPAALVRTPRSGQHRHLAALAMAPGMLAVNDLPTVIDNLTGWVVGILAGAATLFLTIGGARYLMAGGDPGEVERAKGALRSAALGYALAMLAPVFMNILRQILGV